MQFDWTTFALEILNFLVLMWLLQRLFYRPVLDLLAARQAHIEAQMAQAGAARAEAQALQTQYQDKLAQWRIEQERLRQALEQELAARRAAAAAHLRDELSAAEAATRARNAAAALAHEADLMRAAENSAFAGAAAMLRRLASPALTAGIAALLVEDLAALPPERVAELREAARMATCGGGAQIESAHALDDATLARVRAALAAASGCALPAQARVEPALIAGLRIALGHCLLHANLADELEFLRRHGDAHA
ncbi:MAG: F0F1 ATP synthase subunit delta [Rhodocyclaceae bacterium]|nr:F0F1 ATP synthase subunit delta [Rhodocyclaceae bacterium]